MRCKACNNELTDFEATRLNITFQLYEDLCNTCLSIINEALNTDNITERYDLGGPDEVQAMQEED